MEGFYWSQLTTDTKEGVKRGINHLFSRMLTGVVGMSSDSGPEKVRVLKYVYTNVCLFRFIKTHLFYKIHRRYIYSRRNIEHKKSGHTWERRRPLV